MMGQTPEQIIEDQRQDWNRVAGGWEKWDRFFDEQMAFLNHRLVGDARLRAGMRVLDLGSGTGYPALLGAQTVGPNGSVTGLDLAEQMLAAARRKATTLGLSNVTFRTGDVTALPLETNSFDAVTSRFCLMFLPEIPKAAAEIVRVLRPGAWLMGDLVNATAEVSRSQAQRLAELAQSLQQVASISTASSESANNSAAATQTQITSMGELTATSQQLAQLAERLRSGMARFSMLRRDQRTADHSIRPAAD